MFPPVRSQTTGLPPELCTHPKQIHIAQSTVL
jgi:hypothetical protein